MTRFGVGWPHGVDNPATHAQSIANTGCKEVRIAVDWRDCEPTQGHYDWAGLDKMVATIRSKGLGILPIVYRTPTWMSSDHRTPPDAQTYAGFLCMVAERLGAPCYEIWNEPNMVPPYHPGLDWTGSKEQFADLYRTARAALHGRFGDRFQAMVGGIANPAHTGAQWLKSIWPRLGPVDCVGWHPYGLTVEGTWVMLYEMIEMLNSVGSHCPLDVTEVGLPVGLTYSEKARATYLYQCARRIKTLKRVRRWNVFTWYNGPPDPQWDIAKADGGWKGGGSGYSRGIKS